VQDAFAHIDSSKGEGGDEDKERISAAILAQIDSGFKGLDGKVFAAMRDVLLRLQQEAAAEARAAAGGTLATEERRTTPRSSWSCGGGWRRRPRCWPEVIAGYEALEGGPTGRNTL